ncbi:MAG: glutathione S-transferase N-terminal domain-containing protein [Arenicellales bacterium]
MPVSNSSLPKLSLYHRDFCMYCSRVMMAVDHYGIEIESMNVWNDQEALRDLQAATGRNTVPVLKIEDAAGEVTWLPESNDIIRYLGKQALAT